MSYTAIHKIKKVSKLFPQCSIQMNSENISNSSEYLIKYGFIAPVSSGMYTYLPLGLRVLNKLTNLVDNEMETIGAQKLQLPALTPTGLWKKTDRFNNNKAELFNVFDRHDRQYILSPTYEETICDLLKSVGFMSYKLPLKLYQISNKWRDEMKPRFGFFRSREFIMKDLYTFDVTLDDANKSYELVCEAYNNIFKTIGIEFIKAIGDTGIIGGLKSHEYHYRCDDTDDIVCICSVCQYAINKVMCKESKCPQCNNTLLEQHTAEVGHTFLLGTKYTEPLGAVYQEQKLKPLVMGCFGLGLSRIFNVMAQILHTGKSELRWPKNLAPYTVCIITPKSGSKEEGANQYLNQILEIVNQLNIDAILDDRTHLTIGKRLKMAYLTGYPYIIVLGKTAVMSSPKFEVHNVNDSSYMELNLENIVNYFEKENVKT